MEDKKWTTEAIIDLLSKNDNAVDKAMVRLAENFSQLRHVDDIHHARRFSEYVLGNPGKGYPPRRLSDRHAKIFNAQKFVPKGTTALELARELAVKYADMLCIIANEGKLIPPTIYLRTIRSGRYCDTEELWAYRNDCLPEDCKGFPLDIENRGVVTADTWASYLRGFKDSTPPVTEDEFMANYSVVYRRNYYLD